MTNYGLKIFYVVVNLERLGKYEFIQTRGRYSRSRKYTPM